MLSWIYVGWHNSLWQFYAGIDVTGSLYDDKNTSCFRPGQLTISLTIFYSDPLLFKRDFVDLEEYIHSPGWLGNKIKIKLQGRHRVKYFQLTHWLVYELCSWFSDCITEKTKMQLWPKSGALQHVTQWCANNWIWFTLGQSFRRKFST